MAKASLLFYLLCPGTTHLVATTRRSHLQAALFAPDGIWGHFYWSALYPIRRLIRAVARDAVSATPAAPLTTDSG